MDAWMWPSLSEVVQGSVAATRAVPELPAAPNEPDQE